MENQNHIEAYQDLFEYLHDEHDLILLQSEMDEIIDLSAKAVLKYNEACDGELVADTGANAINILLTAGAYLGSLVGKEVSVEPGFIYECRGFNLNENGSGTLYGKNGFCTFGSYKAVRPCR